MSRVNCSQKPVKIGKLTFCACEEVCRLGKGSFGAVFRGKIHGKSDEDVAVKRVEKSSAEVEINVLKNCIFTSKEK